MAQLVERVLGKDEVSGPNPDSSSRKPRREFVGALVLYRSLAELLPGSGSEKNFGADAKRPQAFILESHLGSLQSESG